MLMVASTSIYAQDDDDLVVYKAYRTEFYIYNDRTEEWDLKTKHDDLNITIVFYKNVINVQAKTPSLFKLTKENKETFDREGIYGVTFEAFECVKEYECKVSYVYYKNNNNFLLSVLFENEILGTVNLRYYCK